MAATFSQDFRVISLDLSGHGDSEHRSRYSLEQWTEEVMAVAAAGQINGPPVVIGHSMGGFVTIATAARHADLVSGAIVCDSPVTEPDPEIGAYRLREAFGRPRIYPSVEEAVEHFRTIPAQEHYLHYVIDHVARRSVRSVPGGWQWKFDREVFAQFGGGLRGGGSPLSLTRALPIRPTPVRTWPRHRRHRAIYVRRTGPGHTSHRDPRSGASRHAGPTPHPAHGIAHTARRLGPFGASSKRVRGTVSG